MLNDKTLMIIVLNIRTLKHQESHLEARTEEEARKSSENTCDVKNK
jgi:hypothetical protein